MRREWLLSVSAVALAFVGTQHHNLMMALFALGLGNVGMNLMIRLPLLRDAMLLISVVMAGIIAYQISRPERPAGMRIAGALSILFTLGIAGWSLIHLGL